MLKEVDARVGDIVFYKLAESLLPTRPEKVWKGRVEWSHARKCLFMIVSSLEEGYEGLTEIVYIPQIVSIERQEDHANNDTS